MDLKQATKLPDNNQLIDAYMASTYPKRDNSEMGLLKKSMEQADR